MQKASAPTEAFVKAASEPPLIAADHSMTFVILVRGSLKRKGAFALFLFRRPFMQNHEIAGPSLAPAKRRNLPNRILRAFDNAKHLEGIAPSLPKHPRAKAASSAPGATASLGTDRAVPSR